MYLAPILSFNSRLEAKYITLGSAPLSGAYKRLMYACAYCEAIKIESSPLWYI